MIIAGEYSFKGGKETVSRKYASEYSEIVKIINRIDCANHRTKVSREKTMPGKLLYKPSSLNKAFKQQFQGLGWDTDTRVRCEYSDAYYTEQYIPSETGISAFREMDFIKNRLGVEVQFGKYAFMVYNVCAKMTIFHNLGLTQVAS
jgi:hypothetical protein